MRRVLLFIGWASVVGSLADESIGLCSQLLAGADWWADITLTMDDSLRQLLSFLQWMTLLALYLLPQGVPDGCYRRLCTFQSDR